MVKTHALFCILMVIVKELGFYTHAFNIRIPENASEKATAYRKFYETAIESINDLIKSSRKEQL